MAAAELMSQQILTGDMQGTCVNTKTTGTRMNTFEVLYNHYHYRMGLELPKTLQAITQEFRPKGASNLNIFYETLTHGDLAIPASISDRGSLGPASLRVSLPSNGICELHSNRSQQVELTLVSVDGKRRCESSVSLAAGDTRSVSLGIETAPKGLYFLRVRSDEGSEVFKVTR